MFAGSLFNREEWPWLCDHGQQSGMLTTEAARVGMEGGWTSGDGATTFRGPEGRGEFLRIVDAGRGVDPSRVAGSSQLGSILPLDSTGVDSPYVANFSSQGIPAGDVALVAARTGLDYEPNGISRYPATANVWVSGSASSIGFGYGVARPRNIAYPGRIKLI